MQVKISTSPISGRVRAAASKSAMQRACALALLHDGDTTIHNPGQSNDDRAALSIIQNLGAKLQFNSDESIIITGNSLLLLPGSNNNINCGESGLSIRMFTPIAALSHQEITITGSGSLLTRPMNFFDTILPRLGVSVTSNDGKLPLTIKGPMQPGSITVDGSLSSQFLTGLLIAFAKSATAPVIIHVTDLKSKPYIDLTLQMMKLFGFKVVNENYEQFVVHPLDGMQQPARPVSYTVEGDWSGAAFLLVAGAIAGKVNVQGLDVSSAQADKAILHALMLSKANVSITDNEIEVTAGNLQPFQFDATDCPDLFPPLVALAAYCDGVTVITGVSRLAHKESDRGLTLQEEFAKMGVIIKIQDDLMLIEGGVQLTAAALHSRHDHRIAMATAVAALGANGTSTIDEADSINKSYPNFYEHLQQIGATVSIIA